jgi:hypothetical protein
VDVRVGAVVELTRDEPVVLVRDLFGPFDGARHLSFRWRQYHLRTHQLEQCAPLERHALGHGQDASIALAAANQRQTHPGVAARRLDHHAAR